jgi:hypothetical protein
MKAVKRLFGRKSKTRQTSSGGGRARSDPSHEEQPVPVPIEPRARYSPASTGVATETIDKKSRTSGTLAPPYSAELNSTTTKSSTTLHPPDRDHMSHTSASNVPTESDQSNSSRTAERTRKTRSGASVSELKRSNKVTIVEPPVMESKVSVIPAPSAPFNANNMLTKEASKPAGDDIDDDDKVEGEDLATDESIQYADTDDSDDAGLFPSERTKYKGVSKSFRGLNATEQFEEVVVPRESLDKLASVSDAYDAIPLIEQTKLPRGGISMETKAVGRIQVRKTLHTFARRPFVLLEGSMSWFCSFRHRIVVVHHHSTYA